MNGLALAKGLFFCEPWLFAAAAAADAAADAADADAAVEIVDEHDYTTRQEGVGCDRSLLHHR